MLPVYSAMKGAVHSFTVVLAREVGQHGIRVNAIAPYATIATDQAAFNNGSCFNPSNDFFASHAATIGPEEQALRQRRTFVGKPFATPEEMSGLVAFLASSRASFDTGQVYRCRLRFVALGICHADLIMPRRCLAARVNI